MHTIFQILAVDFLHCNINDLLSIERGEVVCNGGFMTAGFEGGLKIKE